MYIGLTNVNPDCKFMSTPPGLNFGMSVSQRVVREETSSRGGKKPYLSIFGKKTEIMTVWAKLLLNGSSLEKAKSTNAWR